MKLFKYIKEGDETSSAYICFGIGNHEFSKELAFFFNFPMLLKRQFALRLLTTTIKVIPEPTPAAYSPDTLNQIKKRSGGITPDETPPVSKHA